MNERHAISSKSSKPPREPQTQERVFTAYLRSLDPSGEPPDASTFKRLWEDLRRALVAEIRRKGLWEGPPSYLGVFGFGSWREEGAVEEILVPAYTFTFVQRLRSLRVQLRLKENIDGLVIRNLRNFLHERLKDNDPLGFRVYDILRAAVRKAIGAGELFILSGDPRVRNDTAIAPVGFRVVDPTAPTGPRDDRLRQLVARWCSELLPDLITSRGPRREVMVGALTRYLGHLWTEGFGPIGFKELLDLFKAEVRGSWAALFDSGSGDAMVQETVAGLVRQRPVSTATDELVISKLTFRQLVKCVSGTLERTAFRGRKGRYLLDLWQLLRIHAATPGSTSNDQDPLPSQRKLAAMLRIPRERLPELFSILGEILDQCRKKLAAPLSAPEKVKSPGNHSPTLGAKGRGRR